MSHIHDIKQSDIQNITVDVSEGTVTVEALAFFDEERGEAASVYHTFDITMRQKSTSCHHGVIEATRIYAEAVTNAIRANNANVPCTTCSATCCHNWSIEVTEEDVQRLVDYGIPEEKFLDRWPQPSASGHVGEMKHRKDPKNREELRSPCAMLDPKKRFCTVYPARPKVCRSYSHLTCDIYIEDKLKAEKPKKGKITLPVWTD